MMMMASFQLDDPLRIQPPTLPTGGLKTVSIRMKELPGSVTIEISPLMTTVRELITRFHELMFAKTYAAFAAHSSLHAMRVDPVSGAAKQVVLTSLDDVRDAEILVYKPCDELKTLVEEGCITPVLVPRSTPPPLSNSPSMKRKGRCASVANNMERVQRYAPMLDKMDISPRDRDSINDHLISGDDQVVDAMEQLASSRNPASLRRVLRGPTTNQPTVDHLLANFSTLEMQSPANLHFYDSHAGLDATNPFIPAATTPMPPRMMMMDVDHASPLLPPAFGTTDMDNPFLVATTPPKPPRRHGTPTGRGAHTNSTNTNRSRPSLLFDDSALTEGGPSVFLHSIKEKATPPSRMSLSLDDLDATFDELQPQWFSVAALLDNVTVGRNFHECYVVGRVLGSGKYSVVKEATHLVTRQRYAVKIIDKRQMMEVRFLKRELEIMYGLRHDGVVQLMELFESNEELFLVLELCSQELFEYIDRNGPLDEPVAQRLIARLVHTVAYLHANCIVHRDIKPENILIRATEVWDIKLTDFGIARKLEGANCTLTPHESLSEVATIHDVASAMTTRGRVQNRMARAHTKCGTRDYVAPEVMSGKGYGNEADLWSVGVVTYVLLSGCAPVFLPTQDGTKKVFFTEDCWHDLSTEVKQFIEALLVRNPEERITAVEALHHPWLQGVNL